MPVGRRSCGRVIRRRLYWSWVTGIAVSSLQGWRGTECTVWMPETIATMLVGVCWEGLSPVGRVPNFPAIHWLPSVVIVGWNPSGMVVPSATWGTPMVVPGPLVAAPRTHAAWLLTGAATAKHTKNFIHCSAGNGHIVCPSGWQALLAPIHDYSQHVACYRILHSKHCDSNPVEEP